MVHLDPQEVKSEDSHGQAGGGTKINRRGVHECCRVKDWLWLHGCLYIYIVRICRRPQWWWWAVSMSILYSWFHSCLLFPGYGKRLRLCQPMLLYDVLLQSILFFFFESEFTIRHMSKREVWQISFFTRIRRKTSRMVYLCKRTFFQVGILAVISWSVWR